MNRATEDLRAVLSSVIAAVEQEGALLRKEFLRPEGPRGTGTKAPIDREIENRLREVLISLLPCGFVGEETGSEQGSIEGWCWLVDPHDGTRDFLQGQRGSSISVGLVRDGRPVLGVVHCPFSPDRGTDTLAWAEGCGPIRRNGQAVQANLSGRRLAPGELVWATKSAALRPQAYARAVAPARFIALTSIAHRLARLAAGEGAAAISVHAVNEYDIAAGAALARAAGGVVLDAQGREIVFSAKPDSVVTGCFAGGREAAAQLARVEWSPVVAEPKQPPRVKPGFPRIADEARLARAQGCLLGQAIGDSLGSLVEFKSARDIARRYPGGVRDLADGTVFKILPGQPTDDSEMAFALARAIVRKGRFDAQAVLADYRAWIDSGPFDAGNTTRAGLSGSPRRDSEANGSLMRVSPIGIWAAGDPERAARAASEDSALTHPNPVCVAACAGYAAAIAAGVGGGGARAMLEAALALAAGPARNAIERGAAGERPRDYQSEMGWVLVALQNAFFQLASAIALDDGVIATVASGGDTDANGAVAGALLGAAFGRDAFPSRWVLPLLACRPMAEAGALRPRPMHYWPDDILELAEALLLANG